MPRAETSILRQVFYARQGNPAPLRLAAAAFIATFSSPGHACSELSSKHGPISLIIEEEK
jgi:hypothetical protein